MNNWDYEDPLEFDVAPPHHTVIDAVSATD
jgi:hypothetical protein